MLSKVARAFNYKIRRALYARLRCLNCGTRKDLTLHHRDPRLKLYKIFGMWKKYTLTTIIMELMKCDCFCRACHNEQDVDLGVRMMAAMTTLPVFGGPYDGKTFDVPHKAEPIIAIIPPGCDDRLALYENKGLRLVYMKTVTLVGAEECLDEYENQPRVQEPEI